MEDPSVYCMQAVNCHETNPERAVALFTRAMELGSPEGSFGLAEMKINGLGTERDVEGALELYTKSAEAGNSPAMFRLGCIYTGSYGHPED